MATDVVMPQMGESIFEGTVTKWLKKPGDVVERDEPLFEISTDKVDAEIPSPVAGMLQEIKVEAGATVQVNAIVAVVRTRRLRPFRMNPRRPVGKWKSRLRRKRQSRRTSSCRKWASRFLKARSRSGLRRLGRESSETSRSSR